MSLPVPPPQQPWSQPKDVPLFDPLNPMNVNALIDTIEADIETASAELFEDGPRNHLGASEIGRNCSRELWYNFRWAAKPNFASKYKTHGQMLRLFKRGHSEEEKIITLLKQVGFTFEPRPVDAEGKEGQHKMPLAVNGHFGGSMDEIGFLPAKFEFTERILFEFKTSNNTGFIKLKREGVSLNKPVHKSQMSVYGKSKGIKYALYVTVNKDTDELFFEFVKLNWDLADDMVNKADRIINAETGPQRYSVSAAHWECKMCTFVKICHYQEAVQVNCRSCVHAKPVENSGWHCTLHQIEIPKENIPMGCGNHEGIK